MIKMFLVVAAAVKSSDALTEHLPPSARHGTNCQRLIVSSHTHTGRDVAAPHPFTQLAGWLASRLAVFCRDERGAQVVTAPKPPSSSFLSDAAGEKTDMLGFFRMAWCLKGDNEG